jgi:hypothetical protein
MARRLKDHLTKCVALVGDLSSRPRGTKLFILPKSGCSQIVLLGVCPPPNFLQFHPGGVGSNWFCICYIGY